MMVFISWRAASRLRLPRTVTVAPTGIVAIDNFNGTDTPATIWDAIEAKLR